MSSLLTDTGNRWRIMCRKMQFPKGMDFTLRLEQILEAHGFDSSTGDWSILIEDEGSAVHGTGVQALRDPETERSLEELSELAEEENVPSGGEEQHEEVHEEVEEGQGEEERLESKKERKERKRARKEAERAKLAAAVDSEDATGEEKPPKKKKKRKSSEHERREE
jgi:hypothetical protein